jgi:hypothetical protein
MHYNCALARCKDSEETHLRLINTEKFEIRMQRRRDNKYIKFAAMST